MSMGMFVVRLSSSPLEVMALPFKSKAFRVWPPSKSCSTASADTVVNWGSVVRPITLCRSELSAMFCMRKK